MRENLAEIEKTGKMENFTERNAAKNTPNREALDRLFIEVREPR